MAYQGIFPRSCSQRPNCQGAPFRRRNQAYGNVNFLKGGLVFADAITTVSEKYSEEIQSSDEFGAGLQDVVKKRRKDLSGIINGIDYTVWDPSVDELIPHRYDVKSMDLKLENKKALLAKFGLPFDRRRRSSGSFPAGGPERFRSDR